ncbi:MAG: hypothetical protein LC799_20990 [Actinobacteria bacterium]|nr:hypothetical protein [Actinomycetota bacterium]
MRSVQGTFAARLRRAALLLAVLLMAGPIVGTPESATAATDGAPQVKRVGTQLMLGGRPYRYLGFSVPQAATYWPVNWGCGAQVSDAGLDALFSSLRPHSMVSFNAMQSMAFNNKTSWRLDWTAIDRVFAAAARHGQFLIPGLVVQNGICSDGHWKDQAWYDGGYRQAFNDDGRGLEPLPFWDYMVKFVNRYKDHPSLGMWSFGELEASDCAAGYKGADCYGHLTCAPGAAASLRKFFDVVGGEIKRLDYNGHPLTSGIMGGNQCGAVDAQYLSLHQSPAIDVCEVHDYGYGQPEFIPLFQYRRDQCRAAGKVFVLGESGMKAAYNVSGCPTLAQRRDVYRRVIDDYFAGGTSGLMVWQWSEKRNGQCGFDVLTNDPLTALLRNYPL